MSVGDENSNKEDSHDAETGATPGSSAASNSGSSSGSSSGSGSGSGFGAGPNFGSDEFESDDTLTLPGKGISPGSVTARLPRRNQPDDQHKELVARSILPDAANSDADGAPSVVSQSLTGELIVGTVFDGRYDVQSILGSGGMGIVYRAKDRLLNRVIALKVLHRHLLSDKTVMRFQREAETISRLDHPNIIRLYEFGVATASQQYYIVMECLSGQTISELLARQVKFKEERFLLLMKQVCSALKHAHERQVLHRDLKPHNMLVTEIDGKERVKILDFGIARLQDANQNLTATGDVFGSPLYMSPEQCTGERLDVRSDIYALGCVMYEMLSGTPPFVGKNTFDTIRMQIQEPPFQLAGVRKRLVHGEALEAIIMKCLAKQPAQRYQSISELEEELLALTNAGAGGAIGTVKKHIPVEPRVVVSLVVGAAIVAAGSFYVASRSNQGDNSKQLASGKLGESSAPNGINGQGQHGAVPIDKSSETSVNGALNMPPSASGRLGTAGGASGINSPSRSQTSKLVADFRLAFAKAQIAFNTGDLKTAEAELLNSVALAQKMPQPNSSAMKQLADYSLMDLSLAQGDKVKAQSYCKQLPGASKGASRIYAAYMQSLNGNLQIFRKKPPGRLTRAESTRLEVLAKQVFTTVSAFGSISWPKTIKILRDLDSIMAKFPSVSDTTRGVAWHFLGGSYAKADQPEEAHRWYSRSYPILTRELAAGEIEYLNLATDEAKYFAQRGEISKAMTLMQSAKDALRNAGAPLEPAMMKQGEGLVAFGMGCIYNHQKNYHAAEAALSAARRDFRSTSPVYLNSDYTNASVELASVYKASGRNQMAANLLAHDLDSIQLATTYDARQLIKILNALSECCDDIPQYKGSRAALLAHAKSIQEGITLMHNQPPTEETLRQFRIPGH